MIAAIYARTKSVVIAGALLAASCTQSCPRHQRRRRARQRGFFGATLLTDISPVKRTRVTSLSPAARGPSSPSKRRIRPGLSSCLPETVSPYGGLR
jgi:hypothetical protein